MAQGWTVNATTHAITFLEAPAAGVNNVVVTEYAASAYGGTDAFALGAWNAEYGYPTEVEFFADRLWWASSLRDSQTIWGSVTGDYTNHGKSTPMVDTDAVSFSINSRQVNAIMDLVPLDKLIILSKGGEHLMTGGQDEVITPSTIGVKPQSYRGSSGLQAKVVGDTAIFVQEQGSKVYDIGYRFEADGYKPQDISIWAEHLVEGKTLLRMEWMAAPWSVLWFVRDDGIALGCTYLPEQEVIGWHRHDTDGEIVDIVCLPGATQTETYYLVRRTIDGVEGLYFEQMGEIFVEDPRDWFFVDSGLTYDGRNTTATTLTLTTAGGWTEADDLTVTASAATGINGGAGFLAGDVGDGLTLAIDVEETDPSTGAVSTVTYAVNLQITARTSATVVEAVSIGDVPAALQGVAVTGWVFQHDTIGGLTHLEGRRVAVLGDGDVVSNGVSDDTVIVVENGQITLPRPCGVVQVGLPYRGHLETLEVNAAGAAPLRDAKKLIQDVGLLMKDTRGVMACSGDLREEMLFPLVQREAEAWGEPTAARTGYGRVPLLSEWGPDKGRCHIISDEPLPCDILGLIPRLVASD